MAQASETRTRLLAAARRVFAELGYTKARVEDVVNRAGVGHGTFYAYFPNKQGALAALVREHAGTLEELALKPWRAGDVRASLAEVLGVLADLYERDADMLPLWTDAAAQDPELAAMAEPTLFLLATRKEPLDRDQTVEVLVDLWYHALYKGE